MAVEILIRAKDGPHGNSPKGSIRSVKDSPAIWGQNEKPEFGDYIILTISDVSKEQVEHYMDHWTTSFSFDTENLAGGVRRVTVTMDPRIRAKYPAISSRIGVAIRNFITDRGVKINGTRKKGYDASFPTEDSLEFYWPSGGGLARLKDEILGDFEEVIEQRYYKFSEADVDLAIASGGYVTLTAAQAASRINDTR